MAQVGEAYIAIKPDLSRFGEELKAALAKEHVDFKVSIKPDLTGFRALANAELDTQFLATGVVMRPDFSGFRPLALAELKATPLTATVKVKPEVSGLRTAGASLDKAATGVGARMGVRAGRGFGNSFASTLERMPASLVSTPIGAAILGAILALAAPLAGGMIALFAGLGAVAGAAFLASGQPAVQKAATGLLDTFKAAFDAPSLAKAVAGPIAQALSSLRPTATEAGKTLRTVILAMTPTFAPLTAGFQQMFARILLGVRELIPAMQAALGAFAWGLPGIGDALERLFSYLGTHAKEVGTIVKVVMVSIAVAIEVVDFVIQDMIGAWQQLVVVIKAVIWVVQTLIQAWNELVGYTRTALSAINAAVTAAVDAVIGWFKSLIRWINSDIPAAWNFLVSQTTAALAAVGQAFVSAWNSIVGVVSSATNAVVSLAQSLGNRILGAVGNFAVLLYSAGTQLIAGLINGMSAMFGSLTGQVRSIGGRVQGAIGNAASLLYGAGQDVVRGLWNGISSLGGWLAGQVRSFITGNLTNVINSVLGRHSPAQVTIDIGQDVSRGLAVGMVSLESTVAGAANTIGQAAVPVVGPAQLAGLATTAATGQLAGLNVYVYLGDREITDIVRVEVTNANTALARQLISGRRSL